MRVCVVLVLMVMPMIAAGNITAELQRQMTSARPDEMISCIVFMKETYPYDEVADLNISTRIAVFKQIANLSQAEVIGWLESQEDEARVLQRFYVANAFHVLATPEMIQTIARRSDIGWISHNGTVQVIYEPSTAPPVSTRAIEWNIQKVMADSCWTAGFTGQGVILGITDTGVDYTHPALENKWAGYFKAATGLPQSPTPYDDHGHGTHCMGTIMGGDGFGPFADDIGMAPGATFVAAKVLNSGGSGSYDQCLEGLQFMVDLKDSVDIKAVSNSWSGSNASDTFFYPVMRTYKSVNILPVFANGNNGPNPNTVGCPGSYSNNIGVGATDNNDAIASFSSRGPAPNVVPFNDPSTWFRSDWNLIKPQISAPGVGVRSCTPGGNYESWNGTSMATPHVCGAVGLISQKNQNLTTTMMYEILLDNVDEPAAGAPYPNNTYGWGRLNVWQALNGTPTMDQPWISVVDKTLPDINPGQNGNVFVRVKNVGGADANNTAGTLESFDSFVTITNPYHLFGNLAPNDTASNNSDLYVVNAHSLTPPGHVARIGLIIHADGEHDSLDFDDTLMYSIEIGDAPAPTVIYEDDYEYGGGVDSFLNYWDVTGNWVRSTAQSHSPTHSAYSGAVSDNATTLTLKNAVNLSNYTNPRLSLWHMYNFDTGIFMDSAAIHVSTDNGSTWSAVWAYNWLDGNTLPWTEMTQSLPSSNNVKVRFYIDGYTFFQDFTDWYIDDFRIMTPTDNAPPYFENTTVWPDTDFTGPFPVQSTVTDMSGVDSVYLYYRVNGGSWTRLVMTYQGNDIYRATIPAQSLYDTVDYYLWGRDRWTTPNTGCDPVGAPGDGYYSFTLSTVHVKELDQIGLISFAVYPTIIKNQTKIRFEIQNPHAKMSLKIYDASGRVIKDLSNNLESCIMHRESILSWDRTDDQNQIVSAGIYFVRFAVEPVGNFERIEKLILVK